MVPNDAEKDACVCCETAKPGSVPKKKEATAAFGSIAPGGGFTFGGASASSAQSSSTSGFIFGGSGGEPTKGFTFGADSSKGGNTAAPPITNGSQGN